MSAEKRIYLESKINHNAIIELSSYHFNYLIKVMRLKIGDRICVFNQLDGEWLAEVNSIDKKTISIRVCEFLRFTPPEDKNLTLIFAPVKNPSSSFYVQKATELGVDAIVPVLTRRTIVRTLKSDRLEQVAIEAAEQCARISIPKIRPMISLVDINTIAAGKIFFCDEKREAEGIIAAITKHKTSNDAILIGPEGGFDEDERLYLNSLPNVIPVNLGKNILRAETAMIVAIASYYLS